MAAAVTASYVRPLWHMLPRVCTLGARSSCFCTLPSSVAPGKEAQCPTHPWKIFGAVCVQSLPVVSKRPEQIEDMFATVTHQVDLEKSLFSDHELRLLEEGERMRRKKDHCDSDEEDEKGQDIITAEDLQDIWEQKLKTIKHSLKMEGSEKKDHPFLSENLTLLTKQQVGSSELWLLPQLQWEAGETLRQTAERALASVPGVEIHATVLGNAPCGIYKYKFPKDVKTEKCIGAKVFFFKALLSKGNNFTTKENSIKWVKKEELREYLTPSYLQQVKRFVLNI